MKKIFRRFPLNLLSALSVCVFLFVSAGCQSAGTKVQFRLAQDDTVQIVNRLVRTGKIYRNLDTVFVGDLLWHTPALKKAYINEMLKKGRMEQSEYKQKKAEIEETAPKELEFMGALYVAKEKWADFTSPDSIWKLRLVDRNGNLVAPVSIEKIDKKDFPDIEIYSFITSWKTIYRIKFAKTKNLEGMDTYTIRLFSILGDTEFIWKTDKSAKTD